MVNSGKVVMVLWGVQKRMVCNTGYFTFSLQLVQSVPFYPLHTHGYRTVVLDRVIARQISPDAQNSSFDRSIDLN